MKKFLVGLSAAIAGFATLPSAFAADVTLRVHHFMPPPALLPSKLLGPWAEKLEADSEGRIDVEIAHLSRRSDRFRQRGWIGVFLEKPLRHGACG